MQKVFISANSPLTVCHTNTDVIMLCACVLCYTLFYVRTYTFYLLKVTIEYQPQNGACVPLRIHTVVISTQHSEDVSLVI